jgi:hypothetical protein
LAHTFPYFIGLAPTLFSLLPFVKKFVARL